SQSGLHIGRFQVIPDVRIDVFVVVSARQRTQLPVKTLATGVVLAGLAPAIATPVAKGLNEHLQSRLICQDGSAFSGCDVVRRIKTQSGDITEGADVPSLIGRTERIAAVFDQPEIMPAGKSSDCIEIKDVSQSMGDEHGLCPVASCCFKLAHVDLIFWNSNVHEYRVQAILKNRVPRCRET